MPTYEHRDGSKLITPTRKPRLEKSKAWKLIEDGESTDAKKAKGTGSSS